MVKLWFNCVCHGLRLSIGSIVVQLCLVLLGCGGLVCQVVVQESVTLFRSDSVVCGMVQMWFRCVWASVVGSG